MSIDGLGDGKCIKAEPLVTSFYLELAAARVAPDPEPSSLIKHYEGDEPFLERMFPMLPMAPQSLSALARSR